jgi:hypothetical protein
VHWVYKGEYTLESVVAWHPIGHIQPLAEPIQLCIAEIFHVHKTRRAANHGTYSNKEH